MPRANVKPELISGISMIHPHPTSTADFHRLVLDHLRPQLLDILLAYPECLLATEPGVDPASEILDRFVNIPMSEWSFFLMDADQPCAPGFEPPWFYRGTVTCDSMHVMVESDFTLCVPRSFGFRRVHSLLADPMFAGMPPQMHIERDFDGEESWLIGFRCGSGFGWEKLSPKHARSFFLAKLEDTMDVVQAVRQLSEDYTDRGAFNEVKARLRLAYESG